MNKATITSISRVGQSEQVSIQVSFSDGSNKEYIQDLPLDKDSAKKLILEDLARLDSADGQIAALQTLVGKEITN